MLAIRDAVAEIVDDLSAHEDNSDPRGTVDIDVKDQPPLAQISTAEESLSRRGWQLPERWRTEKPVLCISGLGYSMKLLRL